MDWAVPQMTSPAAKPPMPATSGGSGPLRSDHWPLRTMEKSEVVK